MLKFIKKLSLLFILLIANLAQAATIYVPKEYPTIQAAINAASNGDTVLIYEGSYIESVNFHGKTVTLCSVKNEESALTSARNGKVTVNSGKPDNFGVETSCFTSTPEMGENILKLVVNNDKRANQPLVFNVIKDVENLADRITKFRTTLHLDQKVPKSRSAKKPPQKSSPPEKSPALQPGNEDLASPDIKPASPEPENSPNTGPDVYQPPPPASPAQGNAADFDSRQLFVQKPDSGPAGKQNKESDSIKKPELGQVLANLEKFLNFQDYSTVTSKEEDETFGLDYSDMDFDFLWYGRIIKRRVADGWFPPYAARIGSTGRTVITFKVLRNGTIEDIRLRESCGNESLDQAALNAVRSVITLPPLPAEYQHNTLGVIFSFIYNLTEPDQPVESPARPARNYGRFRR